MSFAQIGAATRPDDGLIKELKEMDRAYEDAIDGLRCAQGRLRDTTSRKTIAALGPVFEAMNPEMLGRLPDAVRRIYYRHQRIDKVLSQFKDLIEDWDRERILDQVHDEETMQAAGHDPSAAEETEVGDDRFDS